MNDVHLCTENVQFWGNKKRTTKSILELQISKQHNILITVS